MARLSKSQECAPWYCQWHIMVIKCIVIPLVVELHGWILSMLLVRPADRE